MIYISSPSLTEKERKLLIDAYDSGWISSKGKYIRDFEKNLASFNETKFSTVVSNGTVALHLALLAQNIGPGDEVIVPNSTFAATINAVIYCGAKPVIVDVDIDNYCIDINETLSKINEKTKAIIPVHLYGYPIDLDNLVKRCDDEQIVIIEDAAEALGAISRGKKVGSFGDIGTFSFYGNKIITTGEGGACITNSKEIDDKLKILRDHGMSTNKRYWHSIIGYNYRMTNMQAAIGLGQIRRIHEFLTRRIEIFKLYKEELSDLDSVSLQSEPKHGTHAYWLVTGLFEKATELMKDLQESQIESRPFFVPLSEMPPYRDYLHTQSNVAYQIWEKGVCLPTHTNLSDDDILHVTSKIRRFYKEKN